MAIPPPVPSAPFPPSLFLSRSYERRGPCGALVTSILVLIVFIVALAATILKLTQISFVITTAFNEWTYIEILAFLGFINNLTSIFDTTPRVLLHYLFLGAANQTTRENELFMLLSHSYAEKKGVWSAVAMNMVLDLDDFRSIFLPS